MPLLLDECSIDIESGVIDNNEKTCRICLEGSDRDETCDGEEPAPKMISPCSCIGSTRYVHDNCLQNWIISSKKNECEICKCEYHIPYSLWNGVLIQSNPRTHSGNISSSDINAVNFSKYRKIVTNCTTYGFACLHMVAFCGAFIIDETLLSSNYQVTEEEFNIAQFIILLDVILAVATVFNTGKYFRLNNAVCNQLDLGSFMTAVSDTAQLDTLQNITHDNLHSLPCIISIFVARFMLIVPFMLETNITSKKMSLYFAGNFMVHLAILKTRNSIIYLLLDRDRESV